MLGLQTADINNNTKIVIADDNGAADHLWQLIPDGTGKYRVANYDSGRVLAVAGMSKDNGAQVVQWLDGSATNACTAAGPRAAGKLGNALSYCNTAAYVSLPTGAVSSLTGDFSISAWVNPASNTSWQRIFDIGTGATANMFLTANSGSTIRFAITTGGGNAEQRINGTTTLPLNQWSLVTVTVGGSTGKLYVNGSLVGTNTAMTIKPSAFGQSTRNYLGKSQYSSDPAFNGLIDDFNIYNRELTADEVLNFSTGVAGTGNVLHYTFDENTGANVPDSSGSGRNGTIVNGDSAGTGTNVSTTATDAQTADHFWTLTPAAPELDVTAVGGSRCVAGKAMPTVTVTNNEDVPVTVTAVSSGTTKAFGAIAAGKNAFHAFTTRSATLAAGSITVTAAATVDGAPVTVTQDVAYPAITCG